MIKTILNHKNLYLLTVLLLTIFIPFTSSQNICSNCVDINNSNFTCNNIGCQGFMLTQQQNALLSSGQLNVMCIGGGTSCYYSSSSPVYSQSYYIYIFCNYTFPGCSSCSNDQTCSTCQTGYIATIYNPTLVLQNCQYCGNIIGGCQNCISLTTCKQCSAQYLNIFGLCYSKDGNIIGATTKPWNKNGSTPTQIITAVQLFLGCIIIFVVFYKICYQRYKQNQKDKGSQSVKIYNQKIHEQSKEIVNQNSHNKGHLQG